MRKTLLILLFSLGVVIFGPLEELLAIVGRPLTPLSIAGSSRRVARRTARRTTRRMVAATTVVAASTAPMVVTTTGSLPIGTTMAALPTGCGSLLSGGLTFYQCGGAFYQPRYSGSNLVYVVVMPPQ